MHAAETRTILTRTILKPPTPFDRCHRVSVALTLATAFPSHSHWSLHRRLERIESTTVELPSMGSVSLTFSRTSCPKSLAPPVVLLHGFDSSCLEFRRMMPELDDLGVEAYALDLLGWGFAATRHISSVSVEAKRAALHAFWKEELGGRPMLVLGVSLGAAVLIDFAAAYPAAIDKALLVDPQGFIDGTPPVPKPLARLGIGVLGSWPLRSLANQLAYFDKERLATDDAIRIGLLHCSREQWEDDSVDWLLGGGYSVSSMAAPALAQVPTLVMWGRQDEILPPADFLPKFYEALPEASFRWVEECGHSPHLEQPAVLAEAVAAFIRGDKGKGDADVSEVVAAAARGPLAALLEQLKQRLAEAKAQQRSS